MDFAALLDLIHVLLAAPWPDRIYLLAMAVLLHR